MGSLESFFEIIGDLFTSILGWIIGGIIVIAVVISLATGTSFFSAINNSKKLNPNVQKNEQQTKRPKEKNGCLTASIISIVSVFFNSHGLASKT